MDTAVCSGDSFVCNTYRQPDILYLWSTGDTNAAITCFVPGTYSVKLTLNRCAITDSFTLQHNPYPVVNLPDDTVICQGTSTTLSAAQPGAFYLWSTGDTTASINLSTEQSYHVAVTSLGCTTTDTFVLRTTILPEITLGNDTTICEGQTLKLNADFPYSSYLWNNASAEPLLKTYAAGTYTVMVTNVCGSVVDSIDIKTEVCDCFSWAPNAFTPNGDMTNDVFMPSLSCEYTAFDFRIYSKWGEEIFHSTSALNAWDGRYKGITAPADVYVWKLSCVLSNIAGKKFINDSNGTVTLLR